MRSEVVWPDQCNGLPLSLNHWPYSIVIHHSSTICIRPNTNLQKCSALNTVYRLSAHILSTLIFLYLISIIAWSVGWREGRRHRFAQWFSLLQICAFVSGAGRPQVHLFGVLKDKDDVGSLVGVWTDTHTDQISELLRVVFGREWWVIALLDLLTQCDQVHLIAVKRAV